VLVVCIFESEAGSMIRISMVQVSQLYPSGVHGCRFQDTADVVVDPVLDVLLWLTIHFLDDDDNHGAYKEGSNRTIGDRVAAF
jgi:hypothetical protein